MMTTKEKLPRLDIPANPPVLQRSTSMAMPPPSERKKYTSPQEKYDRLEASTIPKALVSTNYAFFETPKPQTVDFDIKNLVFAAPERQAYGGVKIAVGTRNPFTNEVVPLRFLTPTMCMPFGVTVYNNKRGKSVVMELDFRHRSLNPKIEDFFAVMRSLDYTMLATARARRGLWLPGVKKTKFPDEQLWKLYCATTRMRENKGGTQYPPRLTVKVWGGSSVMFPERMGDQGTGTEEATVPIDEENFPKGTWVKMAIECTGLWIGKESFVPAFRLLQGRKMPPPEGCEGQEFSSQAPTSAKAMDLL